MKQIFSNFYKLFVRELKLIFSNKVIILIFIAAPIVYAFLVGSVYKDASVFDLPIVVVDLDDTPLSAKVIEALDDNQYIKVVDIKYINGNLKDEVITKNYHAIVTIPDRFEADIQQKRYPEIDVDVNAANMLTANYVSTGVQTVLSVINAGTEIETLKKKGISQSLAEKQYEAFKINVTRFFNPSSNYLLFLLPGMLGTIMQQVFLLALALSFSKEFDDKTFEQITAISKSPMQILLGKSLPYFIIGMTLWIPLISISFPIFHIEYVKHQLTFWAVSSLFIISLIFIGISVSTFFKNQLQATEALMVVATPSFIISGQTWPLQQMPNWVQWLANSIPLTHYTEAFRKMILMDADFSQVAKESIALLIISFVFFILSLLIIRIRIVEQRRLIKEVYHKIMKN